MIERIKENIIAATISAIIVAVAVGIWGLVAGGDLVRLLGGATATDLATLTGRVSTIEEQQGQVATATDLATLAGRVSTIEGQQGQIASEYDARIRNFPPIGTIVAFFGRDDEIPAGWALCDGRSNPQGSLIKVDANAQEGGIQLPDLRGKFIRGTETELNEDHLSTGGQDRTVLGHSHLWSKFENKKWYSYTSNANKVRVDDWENGIGNRDEGNFPLLTKGARNMELFTTQSRQAFDNRPEYTELQYIIRIF